MAGAESLTLPLSQPSSSSASPPRDAAIWTEARTPNGKVYFCKYILAETAWSLPVGARVYTPQAPPSPALPPDPVHPPPLPIPAAAVTRDLSGSSSDSVQIVSTKRPLPASSPASSLSPPAAAAVPPRKKCRVPWRQKRMGPSDTAEIDLYGNRPSDYRMGSSQTIVLHASDSESEPENAAEGSGSGSGDGKEPKGFVSPPASQRKRPLQTNTCKVCQRYWRNEDERLPGQLATKHVASCKIHGNKRRPPNTPENFWKQAQLTPPKNPVKPPVYEYEKRQYRKRNS